MLFYSFTSLIDNSTESLYKTLKNRFYDIISTVPKKYHEDIHDKINKWDFLKKESKRSIRLLFKKSVVNNGSENITMDKHKLKNAYEILTDYKKIDYKLIRYLPEDGKKHVEKITVYMDLAIQAAKSGKLDIILASIIDVILTTKFTWVVYKFKSNFPKLKRSYHEFRKLILELPEMNSLKNKFLEMVLNSLHSYYFYVEDDDSEFRNIMTKGNRGKYNNYDTFREHFYKSLKIDAEIELFDYYQDQYKRLDPKEIEIILNN